MTIEPLETRIAPAIIFNFTDVDGDAVTVSISKGNEGDATFDKVAAGLLGGEQLRSIDLNGNQVFKGANITVTATRQDVNDDGAKDGDGFVNVGFIDATGIDLGAVKVKGDLGAIDAGDAANPASACKSLTVHSLGRLGTSTGALNLVSDFDGKLDKLTVKTDVKEAFVNVIDSTGTNGKIGSVVIGGSLIGGALDGSGQVFGMHGLGTVVIKGDIVGGGGVTSGSVTADLGIIASLTVGGSLIGGTGPSSGIVFSSLDAVGPVKIGDDIVGGNGINTGRIFAKTLLVSVSIGGSIVGSAVSSGKIHSDGSIGSVKIGESVRGGFAMGSGVIDAAGSLGAVTLGGSLIGGAGSETGQISSGGAMGAVKIGHDLRGGNSSNAGIIDSGNTLAGVTIGGALVGGEGIGSGSILSAAAMGKVKIAGDLAAGSSFGTGHIHSMDTLAGITIGGDIVGESHTGSAASQCGEIRSEGAMGPVRVAGSIIGGNAPQSGRIFSNGTLASVSIGGSLVGSVNQTGEIISEGALGPVKIGGDIVGGFGTTFFGTDGDSGYVQGQRIASLFVGGSIRAGNDLTGSEKSGSVRAEDDIGSITVKGSLIGFPDPDGNPGNGGGSRVIISARGQAGLPATAKSDVAIKSISIGDSVELAQFLAGYDTERQISNADAQIGAVRVGGNWIASNLVAGVMSADATFGNADDVKISGAGVKDNSDALGAISKIASVLIKGNALGTANPTDLTIFGIEAQHIISIKLGSAAVPLKAGASNDLHAVRRPLGATLALGGDFDFHAFEVA